MNVLVKWSDLLKRMHEPGVIELWKKRVKEVEVEAAAKLAEVRRAAHFTLERKEWLVTRTGSCYHSHACSHVANSAGVKHLKPCAHCVPPTIGAVLESKGSLIASQLVTRRLHQGGLYMIPEAQSTREKRHCSFSKLVS